MKVESATTYNILHTVAEEDERIEEDDDDHLEENHHKHETKKETLESLDFTDSESLMWRKHQFRRFFQNKGKFWTSNRTSTAWRWILVILTGLLTGVVGCFVAVFTETLTSWKLESCYALMESGNAAGAFFASQFLSLFLALCAGALVWCEPAAGGSGIPEIKAYLNGVNLSSVVRMPVLVAKVLGMCFSVASGLPLGKEGPMIHAGSIIGAAVSQGYSGLFLGVGGLGSQFDSSWNLFQDLRNDRSKRDFVTFGAAAGVSAAFKAPIGGILFTLEEGASFWSTATTFRAFICAVITQLTVSLVFSSQSETSAGLFALGQFDNLYDSRPNFRVFELPLFALVGCAGGLLGALFNHINEQVSLYRKKNLAQHKWKRLLELALVTLATSFISFLLPLMWQKCTKIPDYSDGSDHSDLIPGELPYTKQEKNLLTELVSFQCGEGEFNELASLLFTSGDVAMRQLFHFRESTLAAASHTFSSGALVLFLLPYFFLAAVTSGVLAPAGLFVPTLLAGAAFGRLVGHWLNLAAPGLFADSGTYALIGAASVLGGMARMTIAGCVIVLEAAGNISYLLPLMVTFAASRYVGNFVNEPMYDMQIRLKEMPFLEGSLHSLGMLNFHPISEVMEKKVTTLQEVDRVRRVMDALNNTSHNGFPVLSKEGRLRGLVLRKTLCGLLKQKAYSTPTDDAPLADGGIPLEQAATVNFDNLERVYPHFPDVKSVKLSDKEMSFWLDIRAHLDPSPLTLNENTSIHRCYNLFRTMGMRHIVVVNGELTVVGIITRSQMNEHYLKHFWEDKGEQLQKEMNMDSLPQAVAYELKALGRREHSDSIASHASLELLEGADIDPEIAQTMVEFEDSDSPRVSLRKRTFK